MPNLDAATERALLAWIEKQLHDGAAAYAGGYQGATYLYDNGGRRWIIKVAHGAGLAGWLSRWTLRREYRTYQRLIGFAGAPACHGLLRDRYLVLDYVDGVPLRGASIADRTIFFDTLLRYIQELHRRGVAHADLKRKANLLVVDGRTPCLVDFGAAIAKKPGYAPINHYLYALACRFDLNAWIKLKYQGRYDAIAPEDKAHFQRTAVERFARAVKNVYLSVKRKFRA